MLVDSGSSHCFINEQIAAQLLNWHQLHKPVQVQVANGNIIYFTHELHKQIWGIQEQTFFNSFKVVPLGSNDIILGMDWFENHSLMQVHWSSKWLRKVL